MCFCFFAKNAYSPFTYFMLKFLEVVIGVTESCVFGCMALPYTFLIGGVIMSGKKKLLTILTLSALAPVLAKAAGALHSSLSPDEDGYYKSGYDKDGFDREGYDKSGFDKDGFNRCGFTRQGIDRLGYDATKRKILLLEQEQKLQKSFLEFENAYYDELLNRSRIQMEFLLTYILRFENCRPSDQSSPANLHSLIKVCRHHDLLSKSLLDKISIAKNYCNTGSHYCAHEIRQSNIYFTLQTTQELIEYWQAHYIRQTY